MIDIRQCGTQEDRLAAAHLMAELAAWDSVETAKLGFSAKDVLDFYYSNEDEALDGILPPSGLTLLGYAGSEVVGCIAFRHLEPDICEVKRFYVRPNFRQAGFGGALISALIGEARQAGYKVMRLETVTFMSGAIRLYETTGFRHCPPYYDIPDIFHPITIFMDMDLRSEHSMAAA
jgi:GNAT superfamily N-acetyltransferase